MRQIIGIIGGGNMGAAIINGICGKYSVYACEQDKKRCRYLSRKYGRSGLKIRDLDTVVRESGIIILAVKPQDIDAILKDVKACITKNKLVISIAAGITIAYIQKRLGPDIKIIRTMPNLPAQIKEGMTAICKGKAVTKAGLVSACGIFDNIGKTVVVDEKLIDAVTAVSGSGPAYVFLFVEYLNDAAHSLGLNESLTKQLVMQTLKGSISVLQQDKDAPAVLRSRVTSKGGTTQAAMDIFRRSKTGSIFKHALKAAKMRAKELSDKF